MEPQARAEAQDGDGCCGLIVGSVVVAPIFSLLLIRIIEGLGSPLSDAAEGLVFMSVLALIVGVVSFKHLPWPRRLALSALAAIVFVALFVAYPYRPEWVRELEEMLNLL